MVEPREDTIVPIINIKLKLPRARQYVNKGKEIRDPILDRIDKYLNKPTIIREEQIPIEEDWIQERN